MNKQDLQNNILEAKYNRSEWIEVLTNWFGAKQFAQVPSEIKKDNQLWNDYVESAWELGKFSTDDGDRELGIFEIKLKKKAWIERNRATLRNLLNTIYQEVDGALIVFVQDDKWRFSYVSEIRVWDENDKIIIQKTEPKRYTYLFGEGEICRTAADRFDRLKDKDITLADLTEAFSVEKLNKEFFDKYKFHFERFWKYLAEQKKYYELLSDKEREEDEQKTKPIRDFVKILLGRLVFLQFLQKKRWMGGTDWKTGDVKFVQNLFNDFGDKTHFHSTALRTLFFETLNRNREIDLAPEILGDNIKIPYLNGGLFESDISAANDIDFPPEFFKDLFDFFEQYNFTIDENDSFDREVGIDPEMLGHIFENLLEENREKGAFYTPKEIVEYMCQESLIEYLASNLGENSRDDIELLIRHKQVSKNIQQNRQTATAKNDLLKRVKICDPAIGSGAFPMGLLKEIFESRRLLYGFLRTDEKFDPAEIKKEIIYNNIYGVDIESGAVDIARLRFWLALVVDESEPQPLPNLDYKIMQGNSLLEQFDDISLKFDKEMLSPEYEQEKNLLGEVINPQVSIMDYIRVQQEFDELDIADLISKLFDADRVGEKNEIREKIERLEKLFIKNEIGEKEREVKARISETKAELERRRASFKDQAQKAKVANSKKAKDLKKLEAGLEKVYRNQERFAKIKPDNKPYFLWHLYYLDVFENGGFDIVIGNPPYIQLQKMGVDADMLEKADFQTFARTGDIYCLFYEQGNKILKDGGTLCYITSNSWMRTKYGKLLRNYFRTKLNPLILLNFEDTQLFKSATVETNILLAQKTTFTEKMRSVAIQPDLNETPLFQYTDQNNVVLNSLDDEGWIIADPLSYQVKAKIEENTTKLGNIDDISINRGLTLGFSDAFIFDKKEMEALTNREANKEFIKKVLKGKNLKKYNFEWDNKYLIVIKSGWTNRNNTKKINPEDFISNKIPEIFNHIKHKGLTIQGKGKGLFKRDDQGDFWWELRKCAYYDDFEKPKIIWGELSDKPKFVFDEDYHFLNNTCFMMTGENLKYLLAIFNSNLAQWYFAQISTSSGMGTNRWLKYKIEQLPIKEISKNQVKPFETIVDYLTFLHDKTKPNANSYTDNKSIAAIFEDVLNMMVYELYFEEHMKEREIDVLQFVDTDNIFRDISEFDGDEEKAEIIGNAYKWLQESSNPIRDRIALANIKSKDIIRRINSTTN